LEVGKDVTGTARNLKFLQATVVGKPTQKGNKPKDGIKKKGWRKVRTDTRGSHLADVGKDYIKGGIN